MLELGAQLRRGGLAWWALGMQAAASGTWLGPHRLSRIAAPVTVLHGACDPVVPPVNARALARLIPRASCEILDRVGHLVPYEAGRRLREILLAPPALDPDRGP